MKKTYSISREFRAEYAHRLDLPYESKCSSEHGHSARIIVKIICDSLDENDMVMDFAELKPIDQWIQDTLDHSLLLDSRDPLLLKREQEEGSRRLQNIENHKPTSEKLAEIISDQVLHLLIKRKDYNKFRSIIVTFYETEKNSSDVVMELKS